MTRADLSGSLHGMKATTNTTIRLGLLNLPVGVCKATGELADVKFNLGDAEGNKLTQQYVNPDGEVIPADQQTRTVNGHIVPQDDLDAIAEATKLDGLEIIKIESRERFVAEGYRVTGFHYIQSHPKNGNLNAFRLFVDALKEMDSVAITKFTPRSRQSLMVLFPNDEGVLCAVTMSYGTDVREPDQAVRAHLAGKYSPAEMEMAKQLLAAFNNDADPLTYATDEAVQMRHDLVAKVMEGKPVEKPAPKDEPAVSSLAAALEASLAQITA